MQVGIMDNSVQLEKVMNEQLQEALASLIGTATSGIEKGTEFLVDELPDVVYQLLLWYGVKAAVLSVIGIILVVSSVLALKHMLTCDKEDSIFYDEYGWLGGVGIPAALLSGVSLLGGLAMAWNFMVALQICIAPKIWLIEYVAGLGK